MKNRLTRLATSGILMASLLALPEEVEARSIPTPEIPDGVVFMHFLIHAAGSHQDGDRSYRGFLEHFGVDPDLPFTQDLPSEYAAIVQEIEAMNPQTGDHDFDNHIRTQRMASLLGDLCGRLVKAANAFDRVEGRAGSLFLDRLNELLRPSIGMSVSGNDSDLDARLQHRRDLFNAAKDEALLGGSS